MKKSDQTWDVDQFTRATNRSDQTTLSADEFRRYTGTVTLRAVTVGRNHESVTTEVAVEDSNELDNVHDPEVDTCSSCRIQGQLFVVFCQRVGSYVIHYWSESERQFRFCNCSGIINDQDNDSNRLQSHTHWTWETLTKRSLMPTKIWGMQLRNSLLEFIKYIITTMDPWWVLSVIMVHVAARDIRA